MALIWQNVRYSIELNGLLKQPRVGRTCWNNWYSLLSSWHLRKKVHVSWHLNVCVHRRGQREQESALFKERHMLMGDEVTQCTTVDACIESLRQEISIWHMKLVFALQLLLTCSQPFESLHLFEGSQLIFLVFKHEPHTQQPENCYSNFSFQKNQNEYLRYLICKSFERSLEILKDHWVQLFIQIQTLSAKIIFYLLHLTH